MSRLIDADKLMEQKFKNPISYNAFVNLVKRQPTEEPKHGHWTDRAQSILGVPTEACSECAEWSLGFDKNYCPNCGAKMDEVEDV